MAGLPVGFVSSYDTLLSLSSLLLLLRSATAQQMTCISYVAAAQENQASTADFTKHNCHFNMKIYFTVNLSEM